MISTDLPLVSIIIPVINESKSINKVLYSITNSNYPKDKIEIIIAHGNSTDNSKYLIKEFISNNKQIIIKLINNHKNITPTGLNLCITESLGEYIIRLDGHTLIDSEYILRLIKYSIENKVSNVGGICHTVTLKSNLVAKSIKYSMSSIIGVGNSEFRINRINYPKEVDTVPFGCFHKSIFKQVGMFDERLERNQDIELNKRIKKSGGKIILLPDVKSEYIARDNYYDFSRNCFLNGYWNIMTVYITNHLNSLSIRHYVPFLFLMSLIVFSIVGILKKSIIFSSIPILIIYFFLLMINLYMSRIKSMHIAHHLFALMIIHVSYGVGSLVAILKIFLFKKNV